MIGIFDSGSGGLTVLDALRTRLPGHDFMYLGDHANAPYGHRDNQQILELTKNGVDQLMWQGCSLVVLACNTAAAIALRSLQQDWLEQAHPEKRILGVLVPMIEAVTGVPWHTSLPSEGEHKARTILLFATRKTIDSRSYHDEVRKRAPGITLYDKPCPGLVDAIEGGAGHGPVTGLVTGFVKEALVDTPVTPDAVILGCTHFPLVRQHFEAAVKDALPEYDVPIYSQGEIVAEALDDYIKRHKNLVAKGNGKLTLLTTGNPDTVNRLTSFLPDHFRVFERI